MGSAGTPRQFGTNLLVKNGKPHRVLLSQGEVGQTSGDGCPIIELVQRSSTVLHTLRSIDEEGAPEIGILFVLLDVETVLASVNLPVDVPEVVTRRVLPVLYELDRLTEVRTAMHTRKEALHDVSGSKLHRVDAADRFRMQVFFGIGHHAAIRLEPWA